MCSRGVGVCVCVICFNFMKSYYCASLITQLGKDLPAMQETPVQFLGWEDMLEKG